MKLLGGCSLPPVHRIKQASDLHPEVGSEIEVALTMIDAASELLAKRTACSVVGVMIFSSFPYERARSPLSARPAPRWPSVLQ